MKINKQTMFERIIAIDSVLSLNPYFIWGSYSFNAYFNMLKMIVEVAILLIFLQRSRNKIKIIAIGIIVSFIITYSFYTLDAYSGQANIGLGTFSKCIVICVFLALSDESKKNVFRYFRTFFAISLIPGIFFLVCRMIGIPFSSDIIQSTQEIKVLNNQQYRHFFGCVFRENIYYTPRFMQLCGIYDEPGLVGTVAALLLCADQYTIQKNKTNIILLIGGFLSASLAFVLLTVAYLILKLLINRSYKQLCSMLGILLLAITVILILDKIEIFHNNVIARLSWDRLINNNRESTEFVDIFNDFVKSNNLWFGHGRNNPIFGKVDASSYRVLLYNFGIVGFTLIIGWFAYWGIKYSHACKTSIIFYIVFILSIYQRPWIMNLYCIVLMIGGVINARDISEDQPKAIDYSKNKSGCVQNNKL